MLSPAAPRILLVDDDRAFRESTALVLQAYGFPCVAAPDVDGASKLLESETFDVVISDVCMSGNAELAFVKQIAASPMRPAIILVTGYPCIDTAVEALDLRLAAYLIKPFDIIDLSSRIEQALELRQTRTSFDKMCDRLKGMYAELADSSDPIGLSLLENGVQEPHDRVNAQRPADAAPPELLEAGLTRRERELVCHLMEGYRVSTIADELHISPHTVRRHLKSIFLKLEVKSQAELLEKMKPWPQSPLRSSRAVSSLHKASE